MILHFRVAGSDPEAVPLAVHVWPAVPEPDELVKLAGVWYTVASRSWSDISDGSVSVWVVVS